MHIASVFGVCVEKNSELEPALRKFKGRYVLQGNFVTDEYREAAVFQSLSSTPATLEASKMVDAIGLMPGNGIQQADAEQAYAQAEMPASATKVWLRLPREFRPKHFDNFNDPVVVMERALYGHPDSGGHWEQHCEKSLVSIGWKTIPEWRSVYWHPELKLVLMVYVDDFKLAGPTGNLEKGWTAIRKVITFGEDPCDVGRCLGCHHRVGTKTLEDGTKVRTMQYDMTDFMKSCVSRYVDLAGGPTAVTLKTVGTPFLADSKSGEEDESQGGNLGKVALQVLMELLYGARVARYDLLKPVQALAKRVSKWTTQCDQRLHRLMCYVHSTTDVVMEGHVGDTLENCKLRVFADADFAGDSDAKSTSGCFEELNGPHTCFPLLGRSAKQGCTAHCTAEAEVVALNAATREVAIPALAFWDAIGPKGHQMGVELMEDNQATIAIVTTGKNPSLRHVQRTQKVNIQWLHDVYQGGIPNCSDRLKLTYVKTGEQKADIFTKPFTDLTAWRHAC